MKVSRCFVCLGTILFVFMTGVSNAGDYSYKAGIPVWNNPPATWWLDTWRYSGVGGNRHRYNYAVTRVDKSYAPVFRGNKALRFEVRGNRVKGRTFDQANQNGLIHAPLIVRGT